MHAYKSKLLIINYIKRFISDISKY